MGLFKQLNLICGAKEQAKPMDDVRAYIRARGPRTVNCGSRN